QRRAVYLHRGVAHGATRRRRPMDFRTASTVRSPRRLLLSLRSLESDVYVTSGVASHTRNARVLVRSRQHDNLPIGRSHRPPWPQSAQAAALEPVRTRRSRALEPWQFTRRNRAGAGDPSWNGENIVEARAEKAWHEAPWPCRRRGAAAQF